jgi:AraC-like DNA-binding protein
LRWRASLLHMYEGARSLRHRCELGQRELILRPPAPRLRSFVGDYEGYVETGSSQSVLRQQVPATRLPLIFNFGAGWHVADSREGSGRRELHGSFFAGLFDSSTFVAASGPASCLEVDLTPVGAYVLIGIPMHEFANRVVDVEDVLPSKLQELPERLADARSWEARFALVDDALAATFADAREPSAEIAWAWNALVRTSGRVPVAVLAERLGRSRRHLSVRFREHVGLPPKTVARILRFRRAVELLRKRPARSLAELAFECGYYDQAHLNRDFRDFADTSPGDFARRVARDSAVLV